VKAVTSIGGILLPDTVSGQEKNNEAKVVAVGKGYRTVEGKFIAPTVQVGDTVILPEFIKDEVNFEGQEFVIVREEDIVARIENLISSNEVPDIRNIPK
jgi:chaperonin GroES